MSTTPEVPVQEPGRDGHGTTKPVLLVEEIHS